MKEPSYAILGMGRYGRKLAVTLAGTGSEILIADPDSDIINHYASRVTHAVCLDLSNPNALADIGLNNIDVAIVDLSQQLEAAIMCTMVAREQGVRKIIATASTDRFSDILNRIGADEVVIPDDEAAVRMARRLISEDFMEYYDLGGELCVIKTHPKKSWTKKSLQKLRLFETEQVRIIAIERDGIMEMQFPPGTILSEDDTIALAIHKSGIYDFI